MKKQILTCGSCLYLNRERLHERRCSDLGKLPSGKACGSHKPDGFLLVGEEEKIDRLGMMAKAINGMTLNELQCLGALLGYERHTRKHGWRFYQRVYLRYQGSSSANYFSNFTVGYVVTADKDHVRIVGDSGKMMVTAINEPNGNTVFTVERFKKLAADMVRAKAFNDPELSKKRVVHAVVQPLDEIIESDAPMNRKLVKSKTKTDDLVAIIAKMSQGFGIKSKSRKAKKHTRRGDSELVMDWNQQ